MDLSYSSQPLDESIESKYSIQLVHQSLPETLQEIWPNDQWKRSDCSKTGLRTEPLFTEYNWRKLPATDSLFVWPFLMI